MTYSSVAVVCIFEKLLLCFLYLVFGYFDTLSNYDLLGDFEQRQHYNMPYSPEVTILKAIDTGGECFAERPCLSVV